MNPRNPRILLRVFVLCSALILAIAGCGGGGSGGGAEAGPRGATVTGLVLDAATGAPVAGAVVIVGTASDVTDDVGAYTVTNVPTGEQEFRTTAAGYAEFPEDGVPAFYVTVVPGTTTLESLLLIPEGHTPPPVP